MKLKILTVITFLILTESGIAYADGGKTLTLNECIDIALKQSPLIKSSNLDIEVSREALNISKGSLFPRLDLSASYFKENQDIPYIPAQSPKIQPKFSDQVYSWNLNLRMPIYEGGRLAGQVNISEIEKVIQSSRNEFTIQDLIANVTNTFNKILQLKKVKDANIKSVEALERQKKNVELLVKAERAAEVELLRVDVQLASEMQNLIKTDEAISRLMNTLALFMGVDVRDIRDVTGSLRAKEKIVVENVDVLLTSRPDIVALSKKVEQSKIRIDVVSSKRYPSVSLIGNYGNRAGAGFNQREEVWEAGVIASINLFDAGIISAEVRREKALYQKAEEELRYAKLKARVEVDNALSLLREAEQKLTVAEKAVAQSEETLRIEELKYRAGAGTITDVLLSESAMSLANANYYQTLYDYNSAITELKKATGTIEVKR
jgi:outer membrane protein TolC